MKQLLPMFLCWSSGHLRCGNKQLWRHACCGYNRICFQSTTTVYCDVMWVSHRPWYGCCCALGTLPGLMYFQLGYLYWFGPCCCRGLYGSSRSTVGCLLAVMVARRVLLLSVFCVRLKLCCEGQISARRAAFLSFRTAYAVNYSISVGNLAVWTL